MNVEQPKSRLALSKELINLEEYQYLNTVMDVRRRSKNLDYVRVKKPEYYHRSLSPERRHGKKVFRYFTLESLFLLVGLTVSLLILPLVLPPLPPPPFMLLLLPLFILALLMVLAFMPSNARDVTHAYV